MTATEGAPSYTKLFWAKSDRQAPERIHLLDYHLADVGACFEALLDSADDPATGWPGPLTSTTSTTPPLRVWPCLPPCTISAR